ncbi:MAG: response regulator [Candidatus Zixiibacteriota bacterium]|nr:MAG: response regulator [candidate division Zixibacteria bacterium]
MTSATTEKKRTILVIDDDIPMTDLIREILIIDGHRVCIANDGLTGIRLAGEVQPDLILMDITMPVIDGYRTTEQLKKLPGLKDIPVVFLTGRSAADDAGRAFACGGASYLLKPFTNQQIRDLVRLTLEPGETG